MGTWSGRYVRVTKWLSGAHRRENVGRRAGCSTSAEGVGSWVTGSKQEGGKTVGRCRSFRAFVGECCTGRSCRAPNCEAPSTGEPFHVLFCPSWSSCRNALRSCRVSLSSYCLECLCLTVHSTFLKLLLIPVLAWTIVCTFP